MKIKQYGVRFCVSLLFLLGFLPSTSAVDVAQLHEYLQSKRQGITRTLQTPMRVYSTPESTSLTPFRWHFSETDRAKYGVYRGKSVSEESKAPVQTSTLWKRLQSQRNTLIRDYIDVSVRSFVQDRPSTEINTRVERAFDIRLQHKGTIDAVHVDTFTFDVLHPSGIAQDLDLFEIVINEGEGFVIGSDREVTVQFQNARIAQNESLNISVGVRVRDPEQTPYQNGALKLRLKDVSFINERTQKPVPSSFVGSVVSSVIAWVPSGGSQPHQQQQISGRSEQIYGRALSSSQKALVLKLNLESSFDDMFVESLSVYDTLSVGDIDHFVRSIRIIDEQTGLVLDQTRFINGRARFDMNNKVYVARNQQKSLLFEVEIDSTIQTSNNTFRLQLDPRDIDVRSASTGKELSDTRKQVDIRSDIFSVSQSGGGLAVQHLPLEGFAVVDSRPTLVKKISITNNDAKSVSIARISFDVLLSGLEYADGRSIDDFELVQMYQGRRVGALFTPTLLSGGMIRFDAEKSLVLDRGRSIELGLFLKMTDITNGRSSSDSVSVNILSDDTYYKADKQSLKSVPAYFIWSDHSGRPHSEESSDWLSGYHIQGIPSGYDVQYREPR